MIKTPKEVADILKIKIRGVYSLVRQKKLKALLVGRKIRILEADLNQYVDEQRERGTL